MGSTVPLQSWSFNSSTGGLGLPGKVRIRYIYIEFQFLYGWIRTNQIFFVSRLEI